MIRIQKFNPPDNFDIRVKNPGIKFLLDTPNPNNNQWKKHNYWKNENGIIVKVIAIFIFWILPFRPNFFEHDMIATNAALID